MNILITGANGFIGQALCKRMLANGYQVRGTVRRVAQMTALPSRVEGVMVGDIGPDTDWSEALDGIDTVVHLAARVHVMRESVADPLAAFRLVNVEGTKCLAIAAANAGVKRFVYISSVKVNGERTDPQITQITRINCRKKAQKTQNNPQITPVPSSFSERMFLVRRMRMLFPSGKQSSCWLGYPVRQAWK